LQKALRKFYGLDTKANRAQRLETPADGVGIISPKFRDYKSYLSAYKLPWVHKCVTVIAENCANVTYELIRPGKDGGEDAVIESSPFLDLLRRPNPRQTGHELLESIFTDAELTGNAFVALEEQNGRGEPGQLYRLNPANVLVRPDPVELVAGYTYTANGGKEDYAPDEMWQFKYPNPLDELYGMGIIEAAEARIDSEMAMSEHERQFWRNGAKITGVFSTANELGDSAFARVSGSIRNLFRNTGYSTVLLESGVGYTPISESPAKLGLLEMSNLSRDAIAAIFGVPLTKMGILDNANYKAQSADEYFWSETIDPKLTRFENSVQPLIDRFHPGEGLRLKFKRVNFEDDLPAAQVAVQMFNQHAFTVNEIRAYQGADPLDDGDQILGPVSVAPMSLTNDMATVNEMRAVTGDPALPGGDDVILIRARAVAFNLAAPPVPPTTPTIAGAASPPFPPGLAPAAFPATGNAPPQPPPTTGKGLRTGANAPASALVIARQRDALTEHAKTALAGDVARFMAAQEARVTAKVLSHKNKKAALTDDDFLDANDDAALAATLAGVYGYAAKHGMETARTLGLDAAEGADTQVADTATIAGINQTTRAAVAEQVAEGLRRAYSVRQIADGVPAEAYKGVAGVFAEATGFRAETIARTEASRAFNGALMKAYRDSGRVRYVEMIDGTQDADCAAVNGMVVPLDDAAALMGEEHPNGIRTAAPLIG
jgi:HK97 family phage portal protein